MRKNFDIDAYLTEAEERFSGFYGDYDSFDDMEFEGDDYGFEGDDYGFEGDDYGFEGDDYGFEGFDNFAGATYKSPTPYQVTVANTTAGTLTAVLFGKNQYLLSTNFGSATGITVTPAQTNVSYLFLLQQSSDQPFETSLIRIQSSNSSQITQILTVTVLDANGQSATLPIITQSYFSSYQQQSGILDVPYSLKIDGNTSVSFPVLATTTVIITFFPAEKVDVARSLNNKGAKAIYGNPQVNLGGMTFPARAMASRPRRVPAKRVAMRKPVAKRRVLPAKRK
jgi:hypothetical protein